MILLVALAIVAAYLNGSDTSNYGLHLHQTLLISPTIFPIIFAALMGRCFKYIGLFRAERGISLGRLEQLIGCNSLFSALERQITLQSWSVLGFLMTIVWLLSPLGGQSALRLLDTEYRKELSTDTFHYLNPTSTQETFLQGASAVNSGQSTYTSVFLAALLSSSQYQATPMDLWRNVKVPTWSSVANNKDFEGWKTVDYGKNVTYASLIGIPVAGIRAGVRQNFGIKTRQWDITCDSNQEKVNNDTGIANMTSTWGLNSTGGLCKAYPCPFKLASLNSAGDYSVAACKLSYEYVEANVSCSGYSCYTGLMRKLDLLGDGYTNGEDTFTRSFEIGWEMSLLPKVDNTGVADASVRSSTNAEKWMADPWKFIGASYNNVDLYKLAPDLLAERLTIIWNTFWQSTYATTTLGGNLPKNLTELSVDSPFLSFNETQANIVDESKEVYKTNWKWFTALLVSSVILQIAACTGVVLKYITLAPDIVGYASSLTLCNPYIPVPTGGTTLHGLERAALLRHLPIKIGDVAPDEPVGMIAVAKEDDGRVARLDRKRLYI